MFDQLCMYLAGDSQNGPYVPASGSGTSSASDKLSPRAGKGPPPSRRESSISDNASRKLDTIHSDSSAEAQAQYSARSSNEFAQLSQLSNATAIVDSALKQSVSSSGSGPHAGGLPSITLSKELDDLPFQTRLQTVIEGLEQSHSPTGSTPVAAPSAPSRVGADLMAEASRIVSRWGPAIGYFASGRPSGST